MRYLPALFILAIAGSALYAQESPEGSADYSSTWAHEGGFAVDNEVQSKAAEFLASVKPEDFRKSKKSTSNRPQDDSTATGSR